MITTPDRSEAVTVKTSPRSVTAVIDEATTVLAEAGCEQARDDAVVIVGCALGLDAGELEQDEERKIAKAAKSVIDSHVARRSRREPLAYITGWCEFRACG